MTMSKIPYRNRRSPSLYQFQWLIVGLAASVLCSCAATPEVDATRPLRNPVQLQQYVDDIPPSPQQQPLPPVVVPEPSQTEWLEWLASETWMISDDNPGDLDLSIADELLRQQACADEDMFFACPSDQSSTHRPRDEYLCDGGDGLYRTSLRPGKERGVEVSDTVAQYDTAATRGNVVASNRVCVYAPRFAVARQVLYLEQQEVLTPIGGLHDATTVEADLWELPATDVAQELSPAGQIGTLINHALQDAERGLLLDDVRVLYDSSNREIPYQHRLAEETRQLDATTRWLQDTGVIQAEIQRLAEAVEVAINGRPAEFITNVGPPADVFTYRTKSGESKLELQKSISQTAAQTGDTLEFTIRFENVGESPISNIRLVDNLTTRFEFIPGSAECSRRALFNALPNEVGSQKLLWEIRETLEPGDFGVVRFECRVR